MQCSAVQCSTVQVSAVIYSLVQYSADQCCAVHCSLVQYIVVYCSAATVKVRVPVYKSLQNDSVEIHKKSKNLSYFCLWFLNILLKNII